MKFTEWKSKRDGLQQACDTLHKEIASIKCPSCKGMAFLANGLIKATDRAAWTQAEFDRIVNWYLEGRGFDFRIPGKEE